MAAWRRLRELVSGPGDSVLAPNGDRGPARQLAEEGLVIIPKLLKFDESAELKLVTNAVYASMGGSSELAATDPDFDKNFQAWGGVWLKKLPLYLAKSEPDLAARYEAIRALIEARARELFGSKWTMYPDRSYFRRQQPQTKSGKTRWHIDADAAALNQRDCINVWMPLDVVGRELPTLEIVPKSHLTMRNVPQLPASSPWRDEEFVASVGAPVAPILNPGDALVFDQFTLHRTQVIGRLDFVRTACEFRFMK